MSPLYRRPQSSRPLRVEGIVAKLMLRYAPADAEPPAPSVVAATESGGEGYFLFRGLGDRHLDAVEAVLERHRLAIVAVFDGLPCLIGDVSETERATWELLRDRGPANPAMVAEGRGESIEAAARRLEALACRGLAVRVDGGYAAVGTLGPSEAAA